MDIRNIINFPLTKTKPGQGKLLVSEPFLNDPFFRRSVVLLTEHNENGTIGFILNKMINVKLQEAMQDFPGLDTDVFLGGPVARDTLHFLHTCGDGIEESVEIIDGIYWGGNFETLKRLIDTGEVKHSEVKFFVGYAGWAPEQLKKELKNKDWLVTPANPKDIMQDDTPKMWKNILLGLGQQYSMVANFPENPSWN